MHSAIGILRGGPKSRSNISIRSHQNSSTFPYPIGSLELLANKVGLVAQKRSERRRRPHGALPARQQDHGTFKQIEDGPRALIAQDPDMWCSTAGTRGGNVIVDFVGDLGRHRAIADKCASFIDDSEVLSEPRPGAPAVRDIFANPVPISPKPRLDDVEDFACVFVGIFHRLQRCAMALRFVAIQEQFVGLSPNTAASFHARL